MWGCFAERGVLNDEYRMTNVEGIVLTSAFWVWNWTFDISQRSAKQGQKELDQIFLIEKIDYVVEAKLVNQSDTPD